MKNIVLLLVFGIMYTATPKVTAASDAVALADSKKNENLEDIPADTKDIGAPTLAGETLEFEGAPEVALAEPVDSADLETVKTKPKKKESLVLTSKERGIRGNWQKKNKILIKARARTSQIIDLLSEIVKEREPFAKQEQEVSDKLDEFFVELGTDRSKLGLLFASLEKYLKARADEKLGSIAKKIEAGEQLTRGERLERQSANEVAHNLEKLYNEFRNGITGLTKLDDQLQNRLNVLDEQIEKASGLAKQASEEVEAIWQIIDHNLAQKRYDIIEESYGQLEAILSFVKNDFTNNFELAKKVIFDQMEKTKDDVEHIEKQGLIVKERFERLAKIKAMPPEKKPSKEDKKKPLGQAWYTTAFLAVWEPIENLWHTIVGKTKALEKDIRPKVEEELKAAEQHFEAAKKEVEDFGKEALEQVEKARVGVRGKAEEFIQDVQKASAKGLTELDQEMGEAFESGKEEVKKLARDATTEGKGFVQKVTDSATDAWNYITDGTTRLWRKVSGTEIVHMKPHERFMHLAKKEMDRQGISEEDFDDMHPREVAAFFAKLSDVVKEAEQKAGILPDKLTEEDKERMVRFETFFEKVMNAMMRELTVHASLAHDEGETSVDAERRGAAHFWSTFNNMMAHFDAIEAQHLEHKDPVRTNELLEDAAVKFEPQMEPYEVGEVGEHKFKLTSERQKEAIHTTVGQDIHPPIHTAPVVLPVAGKKDSVKTNELLEDAAVKFEPQMEAYEVGQIGEH